jgi:hypothetical protein
LLKEEREHTQTLQTKVRVLQPAILGKGKRGGTSTYSLVNELKGKVFPVSETKAVQKFKSDMEALEFGIE